MPDPVLLSTLVPRSPDDAAALAVAVQANVVALKVAWSRRAGASSAELDIRTPPPGAVRRFREVLIGREQIAGYGDDELCLRLRQVWGEFAALCWAFGSSDPHQPPPFAAPSADLAMRCPVHLQEKIAEVQEGLWRLRHEQTLRLDAEARSRPEFRAEHEQAQMKRMRVFGHDVGLCSLGDLTLAACEYAGMLASLRWLADARWEWEQAGIMEGAASSA